MKKNKRNQNEDNERKKRLLLDNIFTNGIFTFLTFPGKAVEDPKEFFTILAVILPVLGGMFWLIHLFW
ncbi:hypothetical protein [Salibacterium qingdaonense]|uniref:Uncharacterized protein n=1 Tax=Salibacterium qingdaonense TaxID=266892 RepID=A0A1I4MDS5_9BACI|nr:hypothetical protein [Salibacterium qingdaonense]SFM01398.1 hypothetical protein SAMN04488054_11152 [Salibacterium qingdaonense]